MDGKWYRNTTADQMRGMKVRSSREFANGSGSMPAGTIFTIIGKHGGLSLESAGEDTGAYAIKRPPPYTRPGQIYQEVGPCRRCRSSKSKTYR